MGKITRWMTGVCFTSFAILTQLNPVQAHASGLSCCCEMPHVTLYADFIYWQGTQDGLEFAYTGNNIPAEGSPLGAGISTIPRGAVYDPDCHWSPGFRLGAIVDLNCCGMDFYAQYTWLVNHRPKVAGAGGDLTPLWDTIIVPSPIFGLFKAEARTNMHYNVLDFGVGRTFNVNCCFTLRPHLGLKSTWQTHVFDIYYLSVNPFPSGGTATHIHNRAEFDGVGLRSGLDLSWRLKCGFSLVGNMALSAVYTDIRVTRDDSFTTIAPNEIVLTSTTFTKQNENSCALIPVAELLLGVRYDNRLCDCYDFFLFCGWEEQVWFNTDRFIHNSQDANRHTGNLMFQGLVLRSGIGF